MYFCRSDLGSQLELVVIELAVALWLGPAIALWLLDGFHIVGQFLLLTLAVFVHGHM